MNRRSLHLALAFLALLAPAACDSPTGNTEPIPARLDIVSGDLQTQAVAKELPQPLVVRVLDDKGHVVKGQIVNFVVTAGNGSVFAGASQTDQNGEARERWTLGTVAGDTQRVEARAVDPATGEALVFGTFRAVATAEAPSSIAAAGATSFTGLPLLPLSDSVAAVVRDVYGNPVSGTAVVWTVKQGGGSVSPGTSTTGANGVARTSWTLGATLDSLQVIEAAAGLTLKTQFTANGRVPGDAVVVKVSGDAQADTAGQTLPQPLVVRVQRANGTPVAGIPVTFTLPAGNGSVAPATSVSNASGLVSVQWTLPATAGTVHATAAIATGSSVTFAATSVVPTAVSMRFVAPAANQLVADSVVVTVRIDSARASVASVAARVGTSSVTLHPGTVAGQVTGALSLAGVPRGPAELQVTATTVAGDTSIITRTIIHDDPPVVSTSSPIEGMVVRPDLRIDADCTDDDPAGCASIVARLIGGSTTQLASGTTGIHTTVSLAAYDGKTVILEILGTDSRGQRSATVDTLFVESSAALTEAGSGGTRMLDADSSRLLFRNGTNALLVRARPGGVDSLVGNSPSKQSFLHPWGVVFSTLPVVSATGYDWRAGSATSLGTVNSGLFARGGWAVWSNRFDLYRRDLATETNQLVATDANNIDTDVALDGTVAYAARGPGGGYDIYRYNGGTPTAITADDDAVHWNVAPTTDGTTFAYFKSDQAGPGVISDKGHIAMWKGGVETILSAYTDNLGYRGGYDVNNGWVAYVALDGGGVRQIRTRAPDGTDRLASPSGASRLWALAADGTVAYSNGGSLYVIRAPYTGAPVRIATVNNEGFLRFRGTELLFFLGRTVFHVNY